jgi:hypothetical protein
MTNGNQANRAGYTLEHIVEDILTRNSYQRVQDGEWLYKHRHDKELKSKYYAREVYVGESAIKGKRRRVEFFLVDHNAFPNDHLIECKWQEVPGSTEDKLFRLPHDIQKTGIPTTVILDGLGFSPGIIEQLKSHVDNRTFRAVLSIVEFIIAVNRGFLGTGVIKPILPRKNTIIYEPEQLELAFDETMKWIKQHKKGAS